MIYPKLLIISHNLYENTNNIGKTLVSLLKKWPKERICQIYLRDDQPSFQFCDSYYRILDKEVLKHKYKKKTQVGKPVEPSFKSEQDTNEEKMYYIGNKRYPLISLIRDFLWKGQSWKNSELNEWLKKESPDLILFVPNDYELIYPIVEYISTYLSIPVFSYYMDDAFYMAGAISLVDLIRRKKIRKRGKKLLSKYNKIFSISPKMSEEYAKDYSIECITLMNSVSFDNVEQVEKNDNIAFSYVGNLHSNRWKALIDIGKALRQIDEKYTIDIYTQTQLSERIIKKMESVKNIRFMGSVKPSEINNVFNKSLFLLFVEAFDRKSVLSTRLSLSTKIPEYLASKTPIFAYGPNNISSIEYLKNNNLAFVCSERENLKQSLENALSSNIQDLVEKSYQFAYEKHNIEKNSQLFCESLCDFYKNHIKEQK